MVVREVGPADQELQQLALVEAHDEVPVLLAHCERYGGLTGSIWHVEQVNRSHVQQHLRGLFVTLQRCPVDSSHPLEVPVRHAGSSRKQPLYCLAMAFVASPLQCRPAQIVLLLDANAFEVHPLHDGRIVVLGGYYEGSEAVTVPLRQKPSVGLRHLVQCLHVQRLCCPVHCRLTGAVAQVWPSASFQKLRQEGGEAEPGGPVQSSVPVWVLCVDALPLG
mmetsp:Transcript_37790/g.103861  ORF Transcript_37790/g.103861 Transcript_37790/m.103861 type:complete len:220 (+) Transcript_37790:1557-2216(+)